MIRSSVAIVGRVRHAVVHSSRFLASTAPSSAEPSRRQEFKQISVHPSILSYIKSVGIGIPSRKGHSKRRRIPTIIDRRPNRSKNASRRDDGEGNDDTPQKAWLPPPPFGPKSSPVSIIGSVGIDEVSETIDYPKNTSLIPEIAMAGRSNVGKSTLLNALLYGNKNENLAVRQIERRQRGRTPDSVKMPKGIKASMSPKPGETRRISFYRLQKIERKGNEVETRKLMLVDMPGFGFAYAKEDHALGFRKLMSNYLLTRGKALKRVLFLLDARHGMKIADIEFLEMLQQELIELNKNSTSKRKPRLPAIQLVLTKCDLVTQADLARRVAQVRQQLSDTFRREPTTQLPIMMVSARAGVGYNNVSNERTARGGVYELQKELANLATPRRSKATKDLKKARSQGLKLKAIEKNKALELAAERKRTIPPPHMKESEAQECLVPFS